MPRAAAFLSRYRGVAVALAASAAAHALVAVGVPGSVEAVDPGRAPAYEARLEPAPAAAAPVAKPVAVAHARRVVPRPHTKRVAPPPPPTPPTPDPPAPEPVLAAVHADPDAPAPDVLAPAPDVLASAAQTPDDAAALNEALLQDMLAHANPLGLPPPSKEPEPQLFPTEGLPPHLTIDYKLTSLFASAHAIYRWRRDGDAYEISGEAQADGFAQVFLEGSILQESTGTVTLAGLRPDRFTEKKPGSDDEGLRFDWPDHKVTFEVGDKRRTTALTDNTVDWLSMIFQLAHIPPQATGSRMALKVFTQRKLYDFDLKVLGVEEIEIPLGKVSALHLQHVDPDDKHVVDVWLGVDQHYLPVKMRYPVARNRLMVEQSATRLSEW